MAETSNSKIITPLRCFLCCENDWEKLISKSEEICRRFCVLVSRFLDFDINLLPKKVKKEQTLNKNYKQEPEEGDFLICCRKCVPIIESFCVDYDQLINLRLELSSDLRRISKLLRSNHQPKGKCTGKTKVLQRQLLEQCENFFSTKDFPFLKLERYRQTKPEANSDLIESTSTSISVNVINKNDDDDTLPLATNEGPELLKLVTNETSTSSIKPPQVTNHHHDNRHENISISEKESTSTAHKNQTVTFVAAAEYSRHSRYRRILPKPPNPQDVGRTHDPIDKDFKCDHCEKQFYSRIDLYAHQHWRCSLHQQQTVTLQPHQVQVTAENSDSEEHLINPINDESGSTLTTIQNLNSSVTANSPYKCGSCEKLFDSTRKLIQHEKVHFDIRPFACRFCDKKFKFTGHHRDHERIHTGARPFQCPECKKSFKQNAHVRKHLKYHHKIDPDLHQAPARRKSSNNIVGESRSQNKIFGGGNARLMPMENSMFMSCGKQNEIVNNNTAMGFEETPTTLVKVERTKNSNLSEAIPIGNEFILPDVE